MSPFETPFLKMVGINGFTGENPKFEWVEDVLLDVTSLITDNPLLVGATTVNVTPGTGPNFQVGNIIKMESELAWVSAVSADALTITRGVAGTTAAQHAQGVTVEIVGIAYNENVDSPLAGTTTFTFPYNLFQIFDAAIQVSQRQQNTSLYGLRGKDYNFQVAKKFKELAVKLEKNCFLGVRAAASGGVPAMMGGLDTFVTQNVTDLASAALTEQNINDLLQTIFYKVGLENMGRTAFTGAWLKRKISSFYAPNARAERRETTGGVVVDEIDTEFGKLQVSMNIWCPTNKMYVVNRKFAKVGHYKGSAFYDELLPASGAYTKGHIYGDYTLCVKNDKAHGQLKNASIAS